MANRLKTKVVQAPAGNYFFSDSELAFCEIIKVSRNFQTQYSIDTTPSGSDPYFQYTSGTGKFLFSSDNPFNYAQLDGSGARIIEYVTIIYKNSVPMGGF